MDRGILCAQAVNGAFKAAASENQVQGVDFEGAQCLGLFPSLSVVLKSCFQIPSLQRRWGWFFLSWCTSIDWHSTPHGYSGFLQMELQDLVEPEQLVYFPNRLSFL